MKKSILFLFFLSCGFVVQAQTNQSTIDARTLKQAGDSDDSYCLQRAVNLAITTNQTVVLRKGTWIVNNNPVFILVPMGKTVKIKGEAGNLIDFMCSGAEGAVFKTSDTYDYIINWGTIILEGLNFIGSRNPIAPNSLTNFARPILLRDCERIEIRNCSFKNIYGSALAVGAAGSGVIENNDFQSVYGREKTVDAYGDAITVYAKTQNFIITRNTAKVKKGEIGRCGISVDDRCNHIKVTNNTIEGYERGVHIETSKAILISNNTITKSPIAGLSAQNQNVTWENNSFDANNRTNDPILAASGVFFAYLDSACIYRNNTIKFWHGVKDTYLAKFWGHDLLIENNRFTQANGGEVFGYGHNRRNRYLGNKFEGKSSLRLDETTANSVENNEFWGGTVIAHNTKDLAIKNNQFRPDVGESLGKGVIVYNSTNPVVSGNAFYNPATYVVENSLTKKLICEDNTYYRTVSGLGEAGNGFFYADATLPETNLIKATKKNRIKDTRENKSYHVNGSGKAYLAQ